MSTDTSMQPEQAAGKADRASVRRATPVRLLVDTHVHLYPRYEADRFFDEAEANFDRADAIAGGEQPDVGCLMLTETADDDAFGMLLDRSREAMPVWSFAPCDDGLSLWVTRGGCRILVIAGRQVITRERLEVLVLGTRERIADGLGIDPAIAAALETGGQVVLPYGLGKWTGKRAEVATKAFYKWHKRGLRLGDNAGRPRGLPDNGLFHCARKMGTAILPGSDPLNIPSGVRRAGSVGVIVEAELTEAAPAKAVLQGLAQLPASPATFGKRVTLPGCLRQQLALRWQKRKRKNKKR